MADETLPPCPRADCDAYPEDAPHHFHNWWGDSLPHRERIGTCITGGPGLSSRCYSAHVPNVSESPTGSPTAGFVPVAERDLLRARLDAVLALCDNWDTRVKKALEFADTMPEDIAQSIRGSAEDMGRAAAMARRAAEGVE